MLIAFILETLIGLAILFETKTALDFVSASIWFLMGTVSVVGHHIVLEMKKSRALLEIIKDTQIARFDAQIKEEIKENSLTDQEKMAEYGITFDGSRYCYQQYKYARLQDAINYAMKENGKSNLINARV